MKLTLILIFILLSFQFFSLSNKNDEMIYIEDLNLDFTDSLNKGLTISELNKILGNPKFYKSKIKHYTITYDDKTVKHYTYVYKFYYKKYKAYSIFKSSENILNNELNSQRV